MTNARSNIGRELGPLGGLLFAIAAPVLLPVAIVLGSQYDSHSTALGQAINAAVLVLIVVCALIGQSLNWIRKRRARYASPLHRLQDWDDTPLPAEPVAEEYDRWRGTLADRISIWLAPPGSEGMQMRLGWLHLLAYLLWLGLFLGLWAPGLMPGGIEPYSASLHRYWLSAFVVASVLLVLGSLWRWASRTRREINGSGGAQDHSALPNTRS